MLSSFSMQIDIPGVCSSSSSTIEAHSSMAKPLMAWIRVVTLEGMGREKGMCAVEDEMK
jgi:hypothetical protein